MQTQRIIYPIEIKLIANLTASWKQRLEVRNYSQNFDSFNLIYSLNGVYIFDPNSSSTVSSCVERAIFITRKWNHLRI